MNVKDKNRNELERRVVEWRNVNFYNLLSVVHRRCKKHKRYPRRPLILKDIINRKIV